MRNENKLSNISWVDQTEIFENAIKIGDMNTANSMQMNNNTSKFDRCQISENREASRTISGSGLKIVKINKGRED